MKILLIIPCYNEEARINLEAFRKGAEDCLKSQIELSYLFTNDGSSDGTRKLLDNYCTNRPGFYCYHLEQNAGKGNAIQSAYQMRKSDLNLNSFDWIGFWDADLATPLDEIPKMIKFLEFYDPHSVNSIWASRISRLGSRIKRQPHRHYLGRIFVTIVSLSLNVKVYDSQCGAKLFKPKAAELAFQETFLSRWIFDVEILLRLQNQNVIEYPVQQWEDIPGSKVKIFKEMGRVAWDIYRIHNKYLETIRKTPA